MYEKIYIKCMKYVLTNNTLYYIISIVRRDKMLELVQFRTKQKQRLQEIAKDKGISLNALMIMITEDYLKKVK